MKELKRDINIEPLANLVEDESNCKVEFLRRKDISASKLPSEHIKEKYRRILDKDLGRIKNG